MLVSFLLLMIGLGWIGYRNYIEQSAMAQIRALGGAFASRPIGPNWFGGWAQRCDIPVPRIVVDVGLGGTSVNDDDLRHLRRLRDLRTLDLSETDITDAGLIHLEDLSQLQTLILGGTEVTDEGLDRLATLSGLDMLWLAYTGVTRQGVASLQRAMPNTFIYGP
jgi:hypothetical protein